MTRPLWFGVAMFAPSARSTPACSVVRWVQYPLIGARRARGRARAARADAATGRRSAQEAVAAGLCPAVGSTAGGDRRTKSDGYTRAQLDLLDEMPGALGEDQMGAHARRLDVLAQVGGVDLGPDASPPSRAPAARRATRTGGSTNRDPGRPSRPVAGSGPRTTARCRRLRRRRRSRSRRSPTRTTGRYRAGAAAPAARSVPRR